MGITTGRDKFATGFNESEIKQKISYLKDSSIDNDIRAAYDLKDSSSFTLSEAQKWARTANTDDFIIQFAYRCFDRRYLIYSSKILARSREEVCQHQIGLENRTLVTFRAIRELPWQHIFISDLPLAKEYISSLDNCYAFPLYLYPKTHAAKQINLLEHFTWPPGALGRIPNLNPAFVNSLVEELSLPFDPHKSPGLAAAFGSEDIFNYIYAIFHSLTYRTRYAEFLKADFPRLPLTSNPDLFWRLSELGDQLVSLHLLESTMLTQLITRYPIPGGNLVEKGYPKFTAHQQRVYINKGQFFEGVPLEIWDFQIGGYQVCDKWLKDRRGRQLTYEDLTHYQKIIVALNETIQLMGEIDSAIDAHGGWPIQ